MIVYYGCRFHLYLGKVSKFQWNVLVRVQKDIEAVVKKRHNAYLCEAVADLIPTRCKIIFQFSLTLTRQSTALNSAALHTKSLKFRRKVETGVTLSPYMRVCLSRYMREAKK